MANVLKHRFTSGKTDGADPSQVQPSHWNDGHAFIGGSTQQTLVRDPNDSTFGARWAPWGLWTDIPFNASNFASASGAWNVAANNVQVNRMSVVGLTMFWNFVINNSALVGPTTNYLIMTTPFGYPVGATAGASPLCMAFSNDVYSAMYCFWSSGNPNRIIIVVPGGSNFAAGTFGIRTTLTIEMAYAG